MSKPVIVLGMHKSGTTLISSMLHESGIAMVENESCKSYDSGNHYERESTNLLNKRLLNCGERNSLDVVTPLDSQMVGASVADEGRRIVDGLSSKEPQWGFKDPRTCLTWQFWLPLLPERKIVCIYRDVVEVHRHYYARHPMNPMRGVKALRAWFVYNSAMLAAARAVAQQEVLLVDYGRLMETNAEFDRLSGFLGVQLRDQRRKDLHRAKTNAGWRYSADRCLLKMRFGFDTDFLMEELGNFRLKQITE